MDHLINETAKARNRATMEINRFRCAAEAPENAAQYPHAWGFWAAFSEPSAAQRNQLFPMVAMFFCFRCFVPRCSFCFKEQHMNTFVLGKK